MGSKTEAKKPAAVVWRDAPQDHDYPAATAYLSLLAAPDVVSDLVTRLTAARTTTFLAKDILRAARLELLPVTNPHVAGDLGKISKATALSPILMVRGDLTADRRAHIADGYHRVCASYHTDENTPVPVRIVGLEGA